MVFPEVVKEGSRIDPAETLCARQLRPNPARAIDELPHVQRRSARRQFSEGLDPAPKSDLNPRAPWHLDTGLCADITQVDQRLGDEPRIKGRHNCRKQRQRRDHGRQR